MSDYLILNGDALLEHFPNELRGQKIICRECLIDGDTSGQTLTELFQTRSRFLASAYPDVILPNYEEHVVSEFEKILNLPENADVTLWFEDDVFCQVNLWFVTFLLTQNQKTLKIYLARPGEKSPYGFHAFSNEELQELYQNRQPVYDLTKFTALWSAYQNNYLLTLRQRAKELQNDWPFVLPAAEAVIALSPTDGSHGRPYETMKTIMKELDTKEFRPVFHEFSKREAIYGFGDLQVKRLYEKVLSDI